MTTTIQKWGNSQGVRIPKILLDSINWSENEEVSINIEEDKLVIEKAKTQNRKNIKELLNTKYLPYDNKELKEKQKQLIEIIRQNG